MAAAIPGATFAVIAEAGHISHVESPGGFEHAVLPFLLAQGTQS